MEKVLWGLSKISLYLLSLVPFPVLYLISDFCYYILFYIIKYRRHVVMPNLRNSFPEKTEDELRIIEKKYFKFLCDNILESLKMISVSKEQIAKRYVVRNPEEIRKHLDKGKSIIVTGGHYGNWEWGNLSMPQFGETVLIIYKPLANKKFEAFMNGMRSRFGSTMVPMKMTLRRIIEQKGNQYLAFFVSDQTPARVDQFEFIKFLNQDTAVFLGTEKIAVTTGNPLVYCHVNQVKRGYYEVIFTTLFEDPKATAPLEITLAHTKKLESYINARPELWLWSHKRWKFNPENFKS